MTKQRLNQLPNLPIKTSKIISLAHLGKPPPSKPQSPKPTSKNVSVKISIKGKTYTITCPEDEQDELQTASRYIDNFARHTQSSPTFEPRKLVGAVLLELIRRKPRASANCQACIRGSKTNSYPLDKVLNEMQGVVSKLYDEIIN